MKEWKTYTLEEICTGKGAYGIGASAVTYDSSKYTYLRITDINDDGTLNKGELKSVDDEEAYKYILQKNDIVFARTGNSTGRSYFYDGTDGELVYAGFLIKFSLDPSKVNPRIMKYYTHSQDYYDWVKSFDTGGTRGNINAKTYGLMPITLPPREVQDKIVEVLKSIDEKIDLNKRINDNLEQQAQALYKSWFVDFEPFNEDEFVETEVGMVPRGWRIGNLLDVAELYDSKRKPLSGMQRSTMKKIYPYYGATSIMDYVDNYIFDGTYLLMGEDGSVITDEGYPFLQYVSGKFWPNNHAHVMQGKNGFTTEMLHCFLLKKNISEIVTGAVQAKVSQGNMKKISLAIAPNEILSAFAQVLDGIYAKIRAIYSENHQLETMRDTLLPKLMSGELKINEIDC